MTEEQWYAWQLSLALAALFAAFPESEIIS